MTLTQISTAGVKDDAVTSGKIPADAIGSSEIAANAVGSSEIADNAVTNAKIADGNVSTVKIANNAVDHTKIANDAVGSSELADNAVDTAAIADQAVTLAKLPHGTSSNNGKFLRANNGADPTFESIPAGVSINNQASNRVITSDGTNTLNGEADLTFDGSNLILGSGKGIKTNFIRHADGNSTNTGNANQQYWKIGDINLNGSEGAVITLVGANGYSGGSAAAGETTIVLRGSNSSTLLGFWYSDTPGGDNATYSDVRWKHSSGTTYELWVSAGPYNNIAPVLVKTTGSFDNTNAAGTGTNNAPSGSTALPSSHRKKVGSIDTIEYQSTGTIFKKKIYMASNEGIYMDGGSTDANYFDDYEEGTWTPTVNSGTVSQASTARYTKVGQVVHLQFGLYQFSDSTSSNGIDIGGIPFTASDQAVGTWAAQRVDTDGLGTFCTIYGGGTVIQLLLNTGDTTSNVMGTVCTHGRLAQTLAYQFMSLTYRTAS